MLPGKGMSEETNHWSSDPDPDPGKCTVHALKVFTEECSQPCIMQGRIKDTTFPKHTFPLLWNKVITPEMKVNEQVQGFFENLA